MQGPEELVKEHLDRRDGLWEGDIVVEGDRRIRQEVRSMLCHIYSNVRAGSGLSVPPMGLTGLAYDGHIFRDAGIWIMPALLVLHPELARPMTDFRIDRLGQARANAFEHGYDGVMYPWESAGEGMEETPTWALTGVFEHHVTGCVAMAAWQYYCVTGDREWLAERACPMIAAAADFRVSRATTDANTGTALEVLDKMPFVTKSGSDIEVLGKGSPLIYINVNSTKIIKRESADYRRLFRG